MRTTPALSFLLICCMVGMSACSKEAPKQSVPPKEASEAPSSVPIDVPAGGYSLSVHPSLLLDGDVSIEIQTNIPGMIEVMAGIALSGQDEDETWIGKSERVTITNGQASVTLDTVDLPQGNYEAEVSFYPRWGFKDTKSQSTGITETLAASEPISIIGSGESAIDTQLKNKGQAWVIDNVTMGEPWHPADWRKRFGQYEEIPIDSKALNPKIIKAYYFPKIDMTLIVNKLEAEIVIWRMGRANH